MAGSGGPSLADIVYEFRRSLDSFPGRIADAIAISAGVGKHHVFSSLQTSAISTDVRKPQSALAGIALFARNLVGVTIELTKFKNTIQNINKIRLGSGEVSQSAIQKMINSPFVPQQIRQRLFAQQRVIRRKTARRNKALEVLSQAQKTQAKNVIDVRNSMTERSKAAAQNRRHNIQLARLQNLRNRMYGNPAYGPPDFRRINQSIQSVLRRRRRSQTAYRGATSATRSAFTRYRAGSAQVGTAKRAASAVTAQLAQSHARQRGTLAIAARAAGMAKMATAVASTVTAYIALVAIIKKSIEGLRSFAESTLAANHQMIGFSSELLQANIQLRVNDLRRRLEYTRGTAQSATELTKAVDRMRDAFIRMDIATQKLQNRFGKIAAEMAEGAAKPLGDIAEFLDRLMEGVEGGLKRAARAAGAEQGKEFQAIGEFLLNMTTWIPIIVRTIDAIDKKFNLGLNLFKDKQEKQALHMSLNEAARAMVLRGDVIQNHGFGDVIGGEHMENRGRPRGQKRPGRP